MTALISERELAFLLYEFLDSEALLARERYRDHSRHVFDEVLASARRIAAERFAPHYTKGDQNEPQFVAGRAQVIEETADAWRAFADAGFLSAHWDADEGGLQLPEVVLRAAMALFFSANVATAGYPFLTIGSANLLRAFGSEREKATFLAAMGDGRSAGTMALTEPAQGSALGDIATLAVPQPDGSYRLSGQKMFISGGDQHFTENIVHMVLARIEGAPAGTRGISLFLVPKWLPGVDGASPTRNDVALAGLLHKMGWRNTTSTVLSFGERGGATGYLIGEPGRGLAQMFQMMNEARIGVGLLSACLAWRGFAESLSYARERRQGRLPSARDPLSKQVLLIEHPDVRRLLLAQKAYAEGALALSLYASSLFEDHRTHPDDAARERAGRLLDVLTPMVKSWSARYGCAANDMAIQVLGGSGYTRDYPLEQLYRDQRLNPIHEGAEAIHGLDLLGRKVTMNDGAAFRELIGEVEADIGRAQDDPALRPLAAALHDALAGLTEVTTTLVDAQQRDADLALANATLYLDACGRVVVAWLWLRQAIVASKALRGEALSGKENSFYQGKLHAARYYLHWELPAVHGQFALLGQLDRIPYDMQDGWFR